MAELCKTDRIAVFFRSKSEVVTVLTVLTVALLAVLPFLPSLGYGFLIEWDDGGFIVCNPNIVLTWRNVMHNLTSNLEGTYLPLTTVWYMIDNAVFRGNPAGFHLINLLLFFGIAILFFRILRTFRIPSIAAAAIVLLWAWNPCKIEEVIWIAERKGLASSFCALLAMLFFLRDCRRNRVSLWPALLTLIACLFKPWVLPLPGVMVLYAWVRSPHNFHRIARWTWRPILAGLVGAALVSFMTFREGSAFRGISLADLAGVLRYLGAAFLPLSLNPLYPVVGFSEMWPELLWGGVVLVLLWAVSLAEFGKWYGIRLSVAFSAAVAGVALPVLTSGCFTNTNYADRYGFLISMVLWSWAAIVGLRYFRRFSRIFLTVAGVLAAGYLILGVAYIGTFSDAELLFSRAVVDEDCPAKGIIGLAVVGQNRNRPELVKQGGDFFVERASRQTGNCRLHYETTGKLLQLLAPAMRNEPGAQLELGDYLDRVDPDLVYSASTFLARAYVFAVAGRMRHGDCSGAIRLLERQLTSKTGGAYDLGFARGLHGYLTGNRAEAIAGWNRALQAKPGDERILENLKMAGAMQESK